MGRTLRSKPRDMCNLHTSQETELTAPLAKARLEISGMHCASCVSRVEKALAGVPGVRTARVNLVTEEATVEFPPGSTREDDLIAAVDRSGYQARLLEFSQMKDRQAAERIRFTSVTSETEVGVAPADRHAGEWRNRAILGAVGTLLLSWLHWRSPVEGSALGVLLGLVLGGLLFYVGQPYYAGAWRRLRHGGANMDSLIALGVSAAVVADVRALATSQGMEMGMPPFLDAGLILTFVSFGKFLELRAKGRASAAIQRLLRLSPTEAEVVEGEKTRLTPIAELRTGDLVLTRPGQRVAIDAVITRGSSTLDQAWLTGESTPAEKSEGDEILAGTINLASPLTARVIRPADETTLAQVVELVRRAQESKTQSQRLADRVVGWFTPAVLALAVVTFFGWSLTGSAENAWTCAAAVLVVACPCALGLATPTAVMVASGRGAELGILIKDALSLETAAALTTVVFDKTGTLTTGQPRLVTSRPQPGASEADLLTIAAAAERLGNHPLGACLVKEANARGLPAPLALEFQWVPGAGVRANIGGESIAVGNERLATPTDERPDALAAILAERRAAGETCLLVWRKGRLLGFLGLADEIAPSAKKAIANLRALGLTTRLLSGDHRQVAERVAKELGMSEFDAEVLPVDKARMVESLRKEGEVVAMVGDGVNDAPALATADLGVAIGAGADVAIEAADIVLLGADLLGAPRAIRLSRATLRVIRANLAWAFVYNLALLPWASGVFLPWWNARLAPGWAALAMAASSVSVVANSLLLRVKKIDG